MSETLLVVLCTVPDMDVAGRIARGLLEARLAACVSVVPSVRSLYVWNGAIEDATDAQLLIKTSSERYDALEAWLSSSHPYDVPEIVALRAEHVSASYLAWVMEQTRK